MRGPRGVKVGELLLQARRRLAEAGSEAPALEARLLLQSVSGWPVERLLAHPEAELPRAWESAVLQRVERRRAGEPLQVLVGRLEWAGFPLRVNRQVLVPRPETELLLERALELAQRAPAVDGFRWMLDLGTGSGALAVGLALRGGPRVRVLALESEPGALAVARMNAERSGVARRVRFLGGDAARGLAGLVRGRPGGPSCRWAGGRWRGGKRARFLALVVANPPYVPPAEVVELPPEVRREPRRALLAGEGGIGPGRRWAAAVRPWLAAGAFLVMESGETGAWRLADAVGRLGYREVRVRADLAGRPRWVEARWLPGGPALPAAAGGEGAGRGRG
ncbi:MAG: HemK/PrmC family methyltransferase [Bacillota bacterium]|nr:HemK/PrmC family methyltransferase [Bacillota bacterium]